ncbi:Resolvase domain-containing protein [Actinobacteria bacterium OV320]|jgi:DNA invertase Pin-like site-specific DNA recombinase|nr:Resolvase domain-containing protein [Actinobacteria bacterium OV320]
MTTTTDVPGLVDPWNEDTLDALGWGEAEILELRDLKRRAALLPANATRALLSLRLSVLTEETTSPVRQELDLYRMAVERNSRPVGVARDLGVSATKVPPWKRKELGDWIKNRSPEFDEILFWKLDRFVRRISDLHLMIGWCKEYEKTLAAKHDPIDLSTEFGQFMVTIIAGMARIEAANTGVRVESLWQFARSSRRWVIGKPVYGYTTEKDAEGHRILVIEPTQARVLRWVYRAVTRYKNPISLYRACKILTRAGILPPNKGAWSSGNLKVILINPALMGYRVYRPKGLKQGKPSLISYDTDGTPIKIAEGIFTPEEFANLQKVLTDRANKGIKTQGKNATPYLDIMKCGRCGSNWYLSQKTWTLRDGTKKTEPRLRCASFVGGNACGMAAFHEPDKVFSLVKDTILEDIGDYEVVHREYAKGSENLARKLELEASISHYMKELEPGGRFKVGGFIERQAMETLTSINNELEQIDPDSVEDRWIYESKGMTYRAHWETEGRVKMEEDLRRAGITFVIQEDGYGDLLIPEDVKERLIVRRDYFQEQKI